MGYIKEMRRLIGQRKFIHPGVRIFLLREQKELLLIRRTDNRAWGLPAGALEEGETIESCARREVKEETGLLLHRLYPVGISSSPEIETVVYPNGDELQYFTINFYAEEWEGSPRADEVESSELRFFPLHNLPALPRNEQTALDYFLEYLKTKQLQLY